MDVVNDRAIRGAGADESVWQPWLTGQRIRSASMSEIFQGRSRLVVVAPHPDDEILACGGLLATRAEQGLPSQVVAVTDGEASHGPLNQRACARLGARRAAESYAGLTALGIAPTTVTRLGFPDGKLSKMISDIGLSLRPLLKPGDVVVTTWGLDGHPDHEAVSDAVRQAATNAGCLLLEAPVWMWHWSSPGDARIPWKRLVAFNLTERAKWAKQEALSCHRSQLEDRAGNLGAVLVPSIVERAARPQEYFFK